MTDARDHLRNGLGHLSSEQLLILAVLGDYRTRELINQELDRRARSIDSPLSTAA